MPKKTASSAAEARKKIQIHKGRRYCLTQKNKYYGAGEFEASLRILGAAVTDTLDVKVTHLVTADGTLNKTTQKKVDGLVKKGAAIEVVGADDLPEHATLHASLVGEFLLGDEAHQEQLGKLLKTYRHNMPPLDVDQKDMRALQWSLGSVSKINLHGMDLRGTVLREELLFEIDDSNFEGADLRDSTLSGPVKGNFNKADLSKCVLRGECTGSTFDETKLDSATIRIYSNNSKATGAPSFRSACLDGAEVSGLDWESADFSGCSAVKSVWDGVDAPGIRLARADLSECTMNKVKVKDADLTGVNFHGARLNVVDFRGANLKGADFTGALLIDCQLDKKLDTKKIKGLDAAMDGAPKTTKCLAALEAAIIQAEKVEFELLLEPPPGEAVAEDARRDHYTMSVATSHRRYGFRSTNHAAAPDGRYDREHTDTVAEGFMRSVLFCAETKVRFETIQVKTQKSPIPGPKIQELIIAALEEAFGQDAPEEAELKRLTKAYRAEVKKVAAAKKAKDDKEKAKWAKQSEVKEKQAAAKEKPERAQPKEKVQDFETFVAALDVRAQASRMKNAKKMLKGAGFQLFHSADDPKKVLGVIKSQTDESLVYACKLQADGGFTCCTQNLRPCGGLRGALCKHQLVLLMGLAQAGVIDPKKVDSWVELSLDQDPVLDKDEMSDLLLKYKGAEAGEIDWRPTETVPEDFYAV